MYRCTVTTYTRHGQHTLLQIRTEFATRHQVFWPLLFFVSRLCENYEINPYQGRRVILRCTTALCERARALIRYIQDHRQQIPCHPLRFAVLCGHAVREVNRYHLKPARQGDCKSTRTGRYVERHSRALSLQALLSRLVFCSCDEEIT